jgi:hypothetical protein
MMIDVVSMRDQLEVGKFGRKKEKELMNIEDNWEVAILNLDLKCIDDLRTRQISSRPFMLQPADDSLALWRLFDEGRGL